MKVVQPALVAALLLTPLLFAQPSSAQTQTECANLAPLGPGMDDWSRINHCLTTYNSVTLGIGKFRISQPVSFNALQAGASLIGSGIANTTIVPTFTCSTPGVVIDVNGSGRGGTLTDIVVKKLFLNVASCATGTYKAIQIFRSDRATLTNVRVSGGSNGALITGVHVWRSADVKVLNSQFEDMIAGSGGIVVDDALAATVDRNTVTNTDFGIIIRNNYSSNPGDSSNAVVTNNTMTNNGTRAMKLQSSDTGSLPLRNVTVTGNTATGFGATGLYLVANVQNARIENNSFTGAPDSYFGLWIGSINPGQASPGLNASFNNTINYNFFQGGSKGQDVAFNGTTSSINTAGPDQPTISRLSAGTNTLGRGSIEGTPPSSGRCNQYAHAWWNYLNGLNWVPSGGQIILAAAGVRSGSRVIFHFRQNGIEKATRQTLNTAGSNCVLNQENYTVSLPAGLYDVYVDLQDGNARYPDPNTGAGVPINNWLIGKLDVR